MKILPSDNSYRTFCELTSGYRMFRVMEEAVRSGIIDLLEEGEWSTDELLQKTSLKLEEGGRFIDALVNVGLLEANDGSICLSRFSRTFLSRSSVTSQRHVLRFEPILMDNWRQLGTLLREGQGALIQEQSPDRCQERLQLYQRAMAEAAVVRCRELWDVMPNLPENGTIIDIGAGDGTYLREFLIRHPRWQGIACDLADVCAQAATGSIPQNLTFYPCNILDGQELSHFVASHRAIADLLLFSNLCHCYSPEENQALLITTAELVAEGGKLVVHDFFRNANSSGALYDLHMMVNTWNGRCYSSDEMVEILQESGFRHHSSVELPSSSLAIVFVRNPSNLNIERLYSVQTHFACGN